MPADSAPPSRPYVVAIDNSEQSPYDWEGIVCKNANLKEYGADYAITGMEWAGCVERKSLEDYFGCLTDGRERFENSLQRLAGVRYPIVVLEFTMEDLLTPYTYVGRGGVLTESKLESRVPLNSYLSWQGRFRIPFVLCGNRKDASYCVISHFDLVWRLEQEDARQVKRDERLSLSQRTGEG